MKKIKSKKAYQAALLRMEELLKVVGNDTVPTSVAFQELNQVSDWVADYEEEHYAFEADTLEEMIELRMY